MSESPPTLGYIVSVTGSKATAVLVNGAAAKPDGANGVQLGALVKIPTPRSLVFGIVNGLSIEQPSSPPAAADRKTIEVDLFGEGLGADGGGDFTFQRGVSVHPALQQAIFAASSEDLARIYARPAASNARIGSIHQSPGLPAFVVTDRLLGEHFAILGTTGSGKSCAVALILRAVLEAHANGHILLLDPHNEYAAAFGDLAEVVTTATLQIPYWLLNFDETSAVMVGKASATAESEISILSDAIVAAKAKFANDGDMAEHLMVDTPVPYRLSDLLTHIDEAMGRLNKADGSAPFLRLKARIESLRADQRFSFMFAGLQVRDIMAEILSRLFRIPVAGKPITIIDLSGVPSEIVDVVVSVLARMIFDFGVWTEREDAVPLLLVCEEAHRYIPRVESDGFVPTRKAISRIAKEGRKYGVSLCLVTQRPSEISESILSQCSTLFALRMSNEQDQTFVQRALPESALGFLATLPALRVQEAIVVGEGVTVPMRVHFDDLPPDQRPRSEATAFSAGWQEDRGDADMVAETVDRWRRQAR